MDYDDNFKLTPHMENTIEKLKKKISSEYGPEEAEEGQIFRFLRARDFDLVQGESMLKKHIEWKEKYNIAKLYKEFVPTEIQNKYYNMCHIGYSKRGHPVIFFDFGHCDYKGLTKSVKYADLLCGLLQSIESYVEALQSQTKKLGKPVEKWIYIFDCQDAHMSQILYKPVVDFIMDVFYFYEGNYPERLKDAYIVNANPVFYAIFNILKPFLSSGTLGKTRVYGKDGWREEFLKVMVEEEFPAFLGGKKTDPDGNPLCLHMIKFCAPIPKHYYFRHPERRLCNKSDSKTYILKSGEKIKIPLDINEVNSTIKWEFETERGDIGFGLLYQDKKDSEKSETLIDVQRLGVDSYIEDGKFLCEKCGTYILLFDNSHSWIREKQIFLRAFIEDSNGEKKSIL